MERKVLEIYIHIPFCVKKCAYCDFLSFATEDRRLDGKAWAPSRQSPVPAAYIERLCEEICWYGQQEEFAKRPVTSVFFGGGTPSLLLKEQIQQLMAALKENFHLKRGAEITMEANPGTLTSSKLEMMKRCGINRLSMGLQSTSEGELKVLGRIHSYGTFLQSYRWARDAGFKNINVDIMAALPGQTLTSYRETLERVLALEPEHISAYSLIIEPDTPFEKLYEAGGLKLPDEDEERQMYRLTEAVLSKKGYGRYEISNYAKPGFECRHNLGYWNRQDYIGMGLGASSMVGCRRFTNTRNFEVYMDGPFGQLDSYEEAMTLDQKQAMEEFMFLGLRLIRGVSEKDFEMTFGQKLMSVYGAVVMKYQKAGLLERKQGRIFLTERGLDLSNQVMADFLFDE